MQGDDDQFGIDTEGYDFSRFQPSQARVEVDVPDARAMREAGLTEDHRQALADFRATPMLGPSGHGEPDLEDLSIEQLKERLKSQTTDSQAYWDKYGQSNEGHIG